MLCQNYLHWRMRYFKEFMIRIKEFINKKFPKQDLLLALPLYTKETKTTKMIKVQNGSTFKPTVTQSNGIFKRVVMPIPILTKVEASVIIKDYYSTSSNAYLFSEETITYDNKIYSERTFHQKHLLL